MSNVNSVGDWFPNSYPQPKLGNGSWQCGGCRTWYADWVRQCNCQQYNYYPHIPVATTPYTTCVVSVSTDESKDWVLVNGR